MKRMVAFLCLFLFFAIFAYADVGYDGYIVKIKNDCETCFATLCADEETVIENNVQASLFLAESHDGVGVIYSPEGLIKAKDENTLQELVEMGIVEYAEPDLICELYGYVPENNPLYAEQWAHEAINSEYAWDNGIYGQEVKVAVIDSGVSPHPDLEPCLLPGGDFEGLTERGETPGTDTTDNVWHGTFVAGLIAAQCNDIGVVGLAHNVKIVPLKVCDSTTFNISYVIPAIYAAVDTYDCDVINMSLGVSTTQSGGVRYVNGVYESGTIPASISVSNAINHATMNGAIVVAASGNDGEEQTIETDDSGNVIEKRHLSFPAILNNVVSVGNVKQEDTGEYAIDITSTYNEYVDISAPGTSVYSTYYKNASSSYAKAKGTSFSAPYVSAAAALMKCIDPGISYSEFNELVTNTANKSYMTESMGELYWGAGLLDIEALVKAATESDSNKCGDNLTWTLDENGTLTISGTGDMYDWATGEAPWYDNRESIKNVVVENSVTSIGDYAFEDCTSLTSVTIYGKTVTFGGLSTSGSCSNLTIYGYSDSTSKTYADENGITFVPINDITVTYDACGGENAPEAQVKKHYEDLVLAETVPTRTGYNFLGWSTSPDGEVEYAPGDEYTVNEDITFYAVWTIKTYEIKYDANGGENAPEAQTKNYFEEIYISDTIPTRTGYNFIGWLSDSDSEIYSPFAPYTKNEDVTFRAVWQIKTYSITYDANGGVNAPSSQTKRHFDDILISETVPEMTLFDFVGWSTSKDGEVQYVPGDTYAVNEDLKLYAVWQRQPFDCDGGDGTKDSPYLISNAEQLFRIAPLVNTASGMEFYFSLEADIDLGNAEWTPIGTAAHPFNGAFYGNGHAVTNFKITVGRTDNGFFGYVKQADITNLALQNVTLQYNYTGSTPIYAGILAGRLYKEQVNADCVNSISEITVTGSIDISSNNSSSNTGGLAGSISSKSGNYMVKNCMVLADISVNSQNTRKIYIGGVAAKVEDNISKYTLTIQNAYYKGNIEANSLGEVNCGGIAGHVFSAGSGWVSGWYGSLMASTAEGNIAKCVVDGSISINTTGVISTGYVTGYLNAETKQDKCARVSNMTISAIKNGSEYTIFNDSPTVVQPEDFRTYATGTLGFDEGIWTFTSLDNPPVLDNTVVATVVYNAEGGNIEPDKQYRIYNFDIKISETVPEKTGYDFLGWATSENGEPEYQPGAEYTVNEDVTLYAVWKLKTYNVTYDSVGGENVPEAQVKYYFENLVLSETVPEKTGYDFLGWATSESGEPEYQPGAEYTVNEDVTLYAVWKLKTYNVTYDSVGGENAPEAQVKYYFENLVLSETVPEKTGYDFLGWATSENGEPEYQPGAEYTVNEDVTLYAVWKLKTYNVTYDTVGGENAPEAQVKYYFENLVLSETVPEKAGYNFVGWATSPDGEVEYAPGDEYTVNEDVVLCAVWIRNGSGTCGFNLKWQIYGTELRITGSGSMANWSENSAVPWNDYKSVIETVLISNGATSIGSYAFSGCENLTTVTFTDTVTKIRANAFEDVHSLKTVNFAGSLEKLESVEISDYNDSFWNASFNFDYAAIYEVKNNCGEYTLTLVSAEYKGKLFAALYDNCGKLCETKIYDACEMIESISFDSTAYDGCVKFMWLRHADGFKPVCESVILEI